MTVKCFQDIFIMLELQIEGKHNFGYYKLITAVKYFHEIFIIQVLQTEGKRKTRLLFTNELCYKLQPKSIPLITILIMLSKAFTKSLGLELDRPSIPHDLDLNPRP